MATNRRWKKVVFVLVASVLLSACSSERIRINTDTSIINNSSIEPAQITTKVVEQQDSFSLARSTDLNQIREEAKNRDDLVLIKSVASRFKKSEDLIRTIVFTASKYAYSDFPKKEDILAVIAVESTYNTKAHHRGSWGLMQIEARSHKSKYVGMDITNIDANIKIGSEILREYYLLSKRNRVGALTSYNVGIGSYLQGKRNPTYISKLNKEYLWISKLN